jgi:hypothetical protein
MSYVTLKSTNGLKVVALLGETSPILSEGVTTWETVARPKRESITRFSGRNPFKQDIPVVFDAHADGNSVEGPVGTLVKMSTQPHTISISGPVLKTNLDWIIIDITWDDQQTLWKRATPRDVRTRQLAVIHLQEFVDDVVIKTPASPKVQNLKKRDPPKKIKVPKGMTLKQIAQLEFGDPDKWMVIVKDNPILWGITDPRYVVPAGTPLTVWQGRYPGFVVP